MKKLILFLPVLMITMLACDQNSQVTAPDQEQKSVIDSSAISVSGSSASGETELRTRGNADSVRLTVTDGKGNSATDISSI
jgi:hypothetical protein